MARSIGPHARFHFGAALVGGEMAPAERPSTRPIRTARAAGMSWSQARRRDILRRWMKRFYGFFAACAGKYYQLAGFERWLK